MVYRLEKFISRAGHRDAIIRELGMLRGNFSTRYFKSVRLIDVTSILSNRFSGLFYSTTFSPYNYKTNNSNNSPAIPWYLKIGNRERASKQSLFRSQNVALPSNSPSSLRRISQYLSDEIGLRDILIFDLRKGQFETVASKISNFMVLSTARSPKHCELGFEKLKAFIKQEYQSIAYVEGQFDARQEKKRQRRLARKPSLSSNSKCNVPTESWLLVDCKVDRIFVNILTENRRFEINLEELYAPANEKYKYQRKKVPLDGTDLPDEDDILAGLRRLSNQKRQYSTLVTSSALCAQLLRALKESDWSGAINLINSNGDNSLPFLRTIHDWVSELPISASREIPWRRCIAIFEACWPLILPEETASIYWLLRLNFFKMINIADKEHYNINQFYNDYLLAKKASGYPITANDLIEFFKLTIITVRNGDKRSREYWEISSRNAVVSRALRLLENARDGDSIIRDSSLICMLLRTMVSGEEKRPNVMLHSVYEVIDYLVNNSGSYMHPCVISGILEVLAAARSWNKYMAFWESGVGKVMPGKDNRPWDQFIKLVVDSEDPEMIRKLICEGHLLWIKRLEVKITNEMKEQLDRLFEKGDPKGLWSKQLREYLYM